MASNVCSACHLLLTYSVLVSGQLLVTQPESLPENSVLSIVTEYRTQRHGCFEKDEQNGGGRRSIMIDKDFSVYTSDFIFIHSLPYNKQHSVSYAVGLFIIAGECF